MSKETYYVSKETYHVSKRSLKAPPPRARAISIYNFNIFILYFLKYKNLFFTNKKSGEVKDIINSPPPFLLDKLHKPILPSDKHRTHSRELKNRELKNPVLPVHL